MTTEFPSKGFIDAVERVRDAQRELDNATAALKLNYAEELRELRSLFRNDQEPKP